MPAEQDPDRVVVWIDTADGQLEVFAGDDANGVSAAGVRHLADLVNGRAQPAGAAVYDPLGDPGGKGRQPSATLTVPVPGGGPVTISAARHESVILGGGNPLECLAYALRADGAPVAEALPIVARLFGVGTNVAERLRQGGPSSCQSGTWRSGQDPARPRRRPAVPAADRDRRGGGLDIEPR